MEQKSFLFYLNWKEQIEHLDDEELRRFIYNLINYHLGVEVDLKTKIDIILWKGVLPGLLANQNKYNKIVEANREKGKLGGAPKENQNARKQNNPKQPKQTNKRKEENEKRKMKNEKSEEENENRKLETENCQQGIDNSKIENEDFGTNVIDAGKMEINKTSSIEKSLEELQKEMASIDGHMQDLKVQMNAITVSEKEMQVLIKRENWDSIKSNLSSVKYKEMEPLIAQYLTLRDNKYQLARDCDKKSNMSYQKQN
jgi:hypothetical protein